MLQVSTQEAIELSRGVTNVGWSSHLQLALYIVNCLPYLDVPRFILEGTSSSQYVRALRLRGALCLTANLRLWLKYQPILS